MSKGDFELDAEDSDAATEIAIDIGALLRCSVCHHIWSTGEVDGDDLEEVAAAVAELGEDATDAFDGHEDRMNAAVASVISEAPPEKQCSHP